ncbi:unnamed protein product [Didymodactylos carnosus]|uniref:Uncharacterized protein n=1 Tax=Didymodactylos carnosus TaxID=1234261 RepID=A0A815Y151_9BILA|nr:unnamed protein product [Didymodactylos carnosus]CAF1565132.1 unnamed protein product [Didymodactylos carnosus]CAF4128545.1 unnamed protein product [Didymodactylos carnosus]CAF4427148.1 unnamed protein product [Didymodactylos carnosus]
MNSFLSTSKFKDVALIFAKCVPISEQLQAVLFDIYIENTKRYDTKPFADVTNVSYFKDEDEILFDLGTVFRIIDIEYDLHEKIWNIKLKLIGKNDNKLRNVYVSIKRLFPKATTFISLGVILRDMGEYDKAEKYNLEYLNTLNDDSEHISPI